MGTAMGARPITGAVGQQDGAARPMTAVRAAGYTSAGIRGELFLVFQFSEGFTGSEIRSFPFFHCNLSNVRLLNVLS